MMIGRQNVKILGAAAALLLGVAAVPAQAASPQQTLKKRTQQVAALLKSKTVPGTRAHAKKKIRMQKIVRSFLDYGELAKRSLWFHWKKRTIKERAEFTRILRDLIEDKVLSNLASHATFSVEYKETTRKGKTALVKTTVQIPDKPEIDLDYRFTRSHGRWMIYDLVTDGTSLVRNYRSQFNRIIGKHGYPYLVRKMRSKLNDRRSARKVASGSIAG